MRVLQKPRNDEFSSSMLDYIIETDVPVNFTVKFAGKVIIDEEYVPDANNMIYVRRLGKVCELALWGVWFAGEATTRQEVAGTFSFFIDGKQDSSSFVTYCCRMTDKNPDKPGILSEVRQKVTRRGSFEYVTGYLMPAEQPYYEITFYPRLDEPKTVRVTPINYGAEYPHTVDVSFDKLQLDYQLHDILRYQVRMADGVMEFLLDQTEYSSVRSFRFKNIFDVPEVMSCTGQLKLSGSNQADIVSVLGVERKFGVVVTDEYTIHSGPVYLQSDYRLWHSLLNAQEVAIRSDGQWLPVVITKQKFERDYQPGQMTSVEFTFRLADKDKNNILAL